MYGLSLETCLSNLKSVALTVLKLLACKAQTFGGHLILATPLFGKFFNGSCPNLKSVALSVLELLAFNAQKWGHVTLATPLFEIF